MGSLEILTSYMPEFKVVPYAHDGTLDSVMNQRAFMHSGAYKKIFTFKQKDSKDARNYGGYLKITHGNRKVYLKYQSQNGVSGDEVQLTYAVRSALDVVVGKNEAPKEVKIEKAGWFCYYFYNSDEGIRCPFRLAVAGLILTIIGCIISVISLAK